MARATKTKKKEKLPGIKIKFWVYISNNGDGSSSVHFFPTQNAAEAFCAEDFERHCDDIEEVTLRVDEKGSLLQPPKTKLNEKGFLIEDFTLPGNKKGEVYTYNDLCDWSWNG